MSDQLARTPWLPSGTHPVRYGFYERKFTDGIYLQYWDGFVWRAGHGRPPHWRQFNDYPEWRGLVEDQTAVRKEQDRSAFEQWLPSLEAGMPDFLPSGIWCEFSRDEKGNYRSNRVQRAWSIWQAGQSSPYRTPA